ncbi:hypothetical protein ACFW24_22535 [Streptomyces nigra]|uniref:hypothetical protein n=1 Tax=Streptomyces nigra TaxID=1827580 RepID=UPI0036BE9A3E
MGGVGEHINPGLLRILDRLQDMRAEIIAELGETLRRSPLGVALGYAGPDRSIGYRGLPTPPLDTPTRPGHTLLTRMFASNLLDVATLRGPGSRTMHLIDLLLARREELRKMWEQHLKRSVVPRFSDCRDAFQRTTGRSA